MHPDVKPVEEKIESSVVRHLHCSSFGNNISIRLKSACAADQVTYQGYKKADMGNVRIERGKRLPFIEQGWVLFIHVLAADGYLFNLFPEIEPAYRDKPVYAANQGVYREEKDKEDQEGYPPGDP